MVDGVELVLGHQPLEVRELQRDDALAASAARAMPPTKSLRSGTWASTLLPTMRSAGLAFGDQLLGELDAEELDPRRHALARSAPAATLARRLDAEHRHAERQEMLQQIAVVAGELDHEAVRAQAEAVACIITQ